jgi:hypothetical protein
MSWHVPGEESKTHFLSFFSFEECFDVAIPDNFANSLNSILVVQSSKWRPK